jgi:phosphatidylserine synthase
LILADDGFAPQVSFVISSPTGAIPERDGDWAEREARSTFKPKDVEEPIDFWVNRPLAHHLVRFLAPLPITPNQVTLLSGLVGLLAGIVIATAPLEPSLQVPFGGVLLYLSILLDCADGQLARLRGETSMVGRMLDGCVDVIPTGAVFVGFFIFMWRAGYDPIFLNVVGWAAGYCLKWHVHSYDHAKNLYLANVLPPSERSKPLPTYDEIRRERDAHRARGDEFGALILSGFLRFTRAQRTGFQATRIGLGLPAPATGAERAHYRDQFRKTMRLWSYNGLAIHLTFLLIAACFTPFYRGAALVSWFFILVPMNLLTVYLRTTERRIEESLQVELLAIQQQ